ncbi:HD domain-containing protein [Siccirubricoccus sp. G192]|uniref:HD domain-containing protein n=1 Tax=Siccirubricoccus sp. G192 TaxID=2849651 RepID=UPI001C2CB490|nr:HD domain-containing protein [Siccirubricoccus sp. G192]MBV1799951.1 HD domain-containing protein [Siccirubricoccus sp. G192]
MAEVTEALRRQMREELPEVASIQDAGLRERVVEAWALAIARSSWRSIRDIPPAGNPGQMLLTRGDQTDHIRGVTRLAMRMAEEMAASNPDMPIRHDIVVAGGLCHDIGKPWEFDPENRRRWEAAPRATGLPSIRHPAYGVHLCLLAGLPEEVAHIAGAHSGEGELVVRSLESTVVHLADIGWWTMALAGGIVKPETISAKYRRPISL